MSCTHENRRPWQRCPGCGEYKPISPTEVSTWRNCRRKGAFRYASNTPRPPEKESARTGKELHAIQEAYLKHGTAPGPEGLGALARAGLAHLPPPGVGEVEQEFTRTIEGIPFLGLKDWRGRSDDVPGLPPGLPAVIDHKTSKDPGRYGIWSLADRLDDEQSLIYAADECIDTDTSVVLRWLYYPTKGRARVKPSDHTLHYREIRGGLERVVLPVAEKIWILRGQELDPNTVEPNAAHCNDFGGCDYRAVCTVNNQQKARAIFGGTVGGSDMAGLWDKINKAAPAGGPATVDGINGRVLPGAGASAAGTPAGFAFSFGQPATAGAAPVATPTVVPGDVVLPTQTAPERRDCIPAPSPGNDLPGTTLVTVRDDTARVLCEEIGKALLAAAARLR